MKRQIDSTELNFLYTKIGESIWHLQHVENNLATLILIKGIAKELNSLTESEALGHQKRLNKLTLGQLLGKTEKLDIIEPFLLKRIKSLNNERKWIVHNSVTESGHELYTDTGRDFVFTKILAFIDEAIALNKLIGENIVEYGVSKGQSKEQIEVIAINHINKLKGNA